MERKRKGPKPRPAHERLAGKYEVREAGHATPCWIWTASLSRAGYGKIGVGKAGEGHRGAHIASYEHHAGPVPTGLELDHLCRNRACIRPDHLEPVTHAENVRRGTAGKYMRAVSDARTHCAHGHALTTDNEYRWRGLRMCLACKRVKDRNAQRVRTGIALDAPDMSGQAKTHCPHGHEYTEANVRRDRRGCRTCRTCERERRRARRSTVNPLAK